MVDDKPKLSIVVPAYNEQKRLKRYLPAFLNFPRKVNFPVEVVFVDDGSLDSTAQIIEEAIKGKENFHLVRLPQNRGKGGAIKEGMLRARGEFRLFADADNATPIEQATRLLAEGRDYEVVIASRYIKGARILRKQPLLRVLGGRFLNLLSRLVLLPGIADTQCGFKLLSAEAVKRIFPRTRLENFSFDLEVLAIAKSLGYRIKEVPVEWRDDPHGTVNPVRDGLRFLKDLLRIRISLARGEYQ